MLSPSPRNELCDYLDFYHTYHLPPEQRTSLPHFLHKLQDKKQTTMQQEQPAQAISLYYALLDTRGSTTRVPSPQNTCPPGETTLRGEKHLAAPPSKVSGQASQGKNSDARLKINGEHPPGPSQKDISESAPNRTF